MFIMKSGSFYELSVPFQWRPWRLFLGFNSHGYFLLLCTCTDFCSSPRTTFNSFSQLPPPFPGYFPPFPTVPCLTPADTRFFRRKPTTQHEADVRCFWVVLAPDFPLVSCLPPLLCPFRAAISAFLPVCHRFFPICHRKTGGS
jgi:hypothetical protein